MTYPLCPVQCKYCKHLEKKINSDIGRCRELNRKVYLDNMKECEKFTFFLEKEQNQ